MRACAWYADKRGARAGSGTGLRSGSGSLRANMSRYAACGRDLDIVADEITSTDVVGKLSWYFVEFLL
jgi:hypothetical protein